MNASNLLINLRHGEAVKRADELCKKADNYFKKTSMFTRINHAIRRLFPLQVIFCKKGKLQKVSKKECCK